MMVFRASSSCETATTALRALRRRFLFDNIVPRWQTRPLLTGWSPTFVDGDCSSPGLRSEPPSTAYGRRSVSDGLFSAPSRFFGIGCSRCFASQAGASTKVIIVEDDGHFSEVMQQLKGKPSRAVVYFTAQWCGPCKQIAPHVDLLSNAIPDLIVLKVDIDKPELAETLKNSYVAAVPTFHFYKDGNMVAELTGAAKDKLDQYIESLRFKS